MADIDRRPYKKRRFFADEDSPPPDGALAPEAAATSDRTSPHRAGSASEHGKLSSDLNTLSAVVGGEISENQIRSLLQSHENNLEKAINAYYDGSWKYLSPQKPAHSPTDSKQATIPFKTPPTRDTQCREDKRSRSSPATSSVLYTTPDKRYIGSLGVAGWTTRSGNGLLKSNGAIKLDRVKQQAATKLGASGKTRQIVRKSQDLIVRFTNAKGEEVGRLEQESALWVSTLIDQKVCFFDGQCVYAPEPLRTNDTVYLQLRCYLLKEAFEASNFIKPQENNRRTGMFEAKESDDERDLRMRQIALVKLFNEISLHPSMSNAATAKHKREGILQAAEVIEQLESGAKKDHETPAETTGSSPPSEENEDGQELEQDQLDSLYRKAQSFDFNTPEAEPADTFVMNLRKYQKQALHWMISKETSQKDEQKQQSIHPLWEEYMWPTKDVDEKDLPNVVDQARFYLNPYSGEMSLEKPLQQQTCLGGLLADEMGLGKTIEMLSLVHTHVSPEYQAALARSNSGLTSLPRLSRNSDRVEPAPATTLVVAPMSLLSQWASEAEKASKEGSLRVLVYYGDEKHANLQALCSPENAASAPNVVITSYGIVLSEYGSIVAKGGRRGQHGGLFSVEYWRIILDEAHTIKNRQSKTAKACYELSATHRWVLTGTPIVNRLEDLFSLVRFLKVEPWSNFSFWKTFITVPFEKGEYVRALDVVQTVLEPLVMRRTKDMKTPTGEALVPLPPRIINIERVEMSQPEREIYGHIFARAKRTFTNNVEAGTLMKSYTTMFAQILRLRQSCDHPILTRSKSIVAEEEDAANAADIANGLADDMDLTSLLERFQADEDDQDASKFGSHVLRQIQNEAEMECPICSEEPMIEQAVTGCWHSACRQCLLDYIAHQTKKGELPRCFNCREPITAHDVFEVIRHDETHDDDSVIDGQSALLSALETADDEELYNSSARRTAQKAAQPSRITLRRVNQLSSAKIRTLLDQLKKLRKSEPRLKSVVFSQFTSFLDIVAGALQASNIRYLRFDGTMSQKERARVLAEFAQASKFTILLLSLRAGGVGLNLTCAKRVFVMDPWWSWAVEAQAIDRVHRMGQTEEVQVIRYIVTDSIEEKMLRVQERKKFIASSLGMMSEEEKKLQRIEDIRELLS